MHLVYGLVSETKPGFARVQLPTYDGVVTDWLPIVKLRAMNDDENWPLEQNEQVACVVDQYCVTGVILGAISSDADQPDSNAGAGKWRKIFSDGGVMEYDKNAHKWRMSTGSDSLYQLMKDTLTVMKEMIFATPTGNTSAGPLNVTAPGPSGVTITDLLTRLDSFIQA